MEKYYIPTTKVSFRVQDIKMDVDDIVIAGEHYTRLSSKPKGRSIKRTLLSATNSEDRIIVYK